MAHARCAIAAPIAVSSAWGHHDRASGIACKARVLWLFPVFVLFRPVIDGQIGRHTQRRSRGFFVCMPRLTGKGAAPGCDRPPVFPLLFTGKYRKASATGVALARCRCRSASLPHAYRRGHGRGTDSAWRCCHFSEAARARPSSSIASMRCRRRSPNARASPGRGGACACASPSPSRWSRCRRDLRSASTPSDQTGLRR